MENTSLAKQVSLFTNKSFEEYKDWIDQKIKQNKLTTIALFEHLNQFVYLHKKTLGMILFN